MYYIYHIPNKKIGVTRDLNKRVTKEQGYTSDEYEVLFTSEDINYISDMEIELQKSYGYKADFNSYKILSNQFNKKNNKMSINITDQTVTFPVGKTDLKEYLAKSTGLKLSIEGSKVTLNQQEQDWILKNARTSHFRNSRSYVYNKTLLSFVDELKKEKQFEKPKDFSSNGLASVFIPSTFDLIREWAEERGIYKLGDSKTQYVKLMEEVGELAKALLTKNDREVVDSIGDIVVVLTNLAKLEGHDIENCIDTAYEEIKNRKGSMINGTFEKTL
jgi:NTP pyrophosphatase (non-canonical NTP hydrolase)